jgi:hypothetical protein
MATEQTLDTINNANLKTVGEANAWSIAQKAMNDISHAKRIDSIAEIALSNLTAHQGRMLQLSEMVVGKFGENATSLDPIEAMSIAKGYRAESDSALTSTLAALSSGQIGAKVAMTTPPESGVTQLFAQLNALSNQNAQNNNANNSQNLAALNAMNQTNQATNAAMLAIAQVLVKAAQTTPPVYADPASK